MKRSHGVSTFGCSVFAVICFSTMAYAIHSCCRPEGTWSGDNPCTGSSTTFCESGSTTTLTVAWEFAGSSKLAECITWTLGPGQSFVTQNCGDSVPGYVPIPNPPHNLPNSSKCCFAPVGVSPSSTPVVPEQSFLHCTTTVCYGSP